MFRTLIPVLSIIIAVLLFIFFVQPQYKEITALQAEIGAYENAATQYGAFNAKLQSLLSTKNSRTLSDNERLDLISAKKIDTTQLLVDIEALAEKQNMLFGNVSTEGGEAELATANSAVPEEGGVGAQLVTADVTFDVIGTYEQFKNFLQDIESSVVLMEVVNITFSATETSFQQFSVTVRTYALPK